MKKNLFVLLVLSIFLAGSAIAFNYEKYPQKANAQMAYIPDDYNYSGTSFGDPAILMRVNEKVLSSAIDTNFPNETYAEQDRTYSGISSITVCGNRLWSVFRAGGEAEGKNNYFAIYYSDDRGNSWTYYMVMDHPSIGINCGLGTPFLWTDSQNKMWLFYSQQGTWAVEFSGADAALDSMTWNIRQLNSEYCVQKKPIVVFNKTSGKYEWAFMAFKGSTSKDYTYFYSDDNGASWKTRGVASSKNPYRKPNWGEPCLYQKKDGTLVCLCRLENGGGGFEITTSDDFGKTWGSFVMNLDSPFTGPSSKPDFLRLKNGALLFVNHDTTISRTKLTVWISDDDGETWSSKLLLDDRSNVAYPEAVEDSDGNIYVIYDRNRLPFDGEGSMEVRVARITESDIRAGMIVEKNSRLKLCVCKKDFYKDIVSLGTTFEKEYSFKQGVTGEEVIAALPKKISVIDETGAEYELTGKWVIERAFKQGKIGSFTCSYECDLPDGVYDVNGLLKVRFKVNESNSSTAQSGCKSSFDIPGICFVFFAISFIFLNNKKARSKRK